MSNWFSKCIKSVNQELKNALKLIIVSKVDLLHFLIIILVANGFPFLAIYQENILF
jgi:hypothetical protein